MISISPAILFFHFKYIKYFFKYVKLNKHTKTFVSRPKKILFAVFPGLDSEFDYFGALNFSFTLLSV